MCGCIWVNWQKKYTLKPQQTNPFPLRKQGACLENKGKHISAGTVQEVEYFPCHVLTSLYDVPKEKQNSNHALEGVGGLSGTDGVVCWQWPQGLIDSRLQREMLHCKNEGLKITTEGGMCCFQSIKPKLSHVVIKLNSTSFCIIIVIIYHLNY